MCRLKLLVNKHKEILVPFYYFEQLSFSVFIWNELYELVKPIDRSCVEKQYKQIIHTYTRNNLDEANILKYSVLFIFNEALDQMV